MASEVSHRHSATGETLYFTIRNTARQMWNTGGTPNFETLTVANWTSYKIAMSESPASSYFYAGTFPAISGNMVAGWYWCDVFKQAGGSAAIGDTLYASYHGYWDGTTYKFWGDDTIAIKGTPIGGTGTQVADAFTSFFNVASPTGTVNSLPAAVPGASNGLMRIGVNTGDITIDTLTCDQLAIVNDLDIDGTIYARRMEIAEGASIGQYFEVEEFWVDNGVTINSTGTAKHAIEIIASGQQSHGIFIQGGAGVGSPSDGIHIVAGTGGVGVQADTVTTSGAVTLNSLTVSAGTTLTGAVTATHASNDIRGVKADAVAINGNTAAAQKLAVSADTMLIGTIDTAGFTPTTTEFEADDITEATADHYQGRTIIFTSGALVKQATSISDYSLVGGRGHFTVVALTEAPANNDTFIIV